MRTARRGARGSFDMSNPYHAAVKICLQNRSNRFEVKLRHASDWASKFTNRSLPSFHYRDFILRFQSDCASMYATKRTGGALADENRKSTRPATSHTREAAIP